MPDKPYEPRDPRLPVFVYKAAFEEPPAYDALGSAVATVQEYLDGGFTDDTLPEDLRALYAMDVHSGQVDNGGHSQYLFNIGYDAADMDRAIAGYRMIGHDEGAEIVAACKEWALANPQAKDRTDAYAIKDAALTALDSRVYSAVLPREEAEALLAKLPKDARDSFLAAYDAKKYAAQSPYFLKALAFLADWDKVERIADDEMGAKVKAVLKQAPFTHEVALAAFWRVHKQSRPEGARLAAMLHYTAHHPDKRAGNFPGTGPWPLRVEGNDLLLSDEGDHYQVASKSALASEASRGTLLKIVGLGAAKRTQIPKAEVETVATLLREAFLWEAVAIAVKAFDRKLSTQSLGFVEVPTPGKPIKLSLKLRDPDDNSYPEAKIICDAETLTLSVDDGTAQTVQISDARDFAARMSAQ